MSVDNRRSLAICTSVLLCIGVSGCGTLTGGYKSVLPDKAATRQPLRDGGQLRFQSGDKIKVLIYGESKLSGNYTVDASGNISIPLLGVFEAGGRTTKQLKLAISNKLRASEILLNPVVAVSIASLRPFYILGEVGKPGSYPYTSGMNVMRAVAVAGGYTYRASKSYVNIQRMGQSRFTRYTLSPATMIYPGDLINVPERYF